MQVKHHHCLPGSVAGAPMSAAMRFSRYRPGALRHVSPLAAAIRTSGAPESLPICLVLNVWTVLSDIHAISRKALRRQASNMGV
jgi:hypothetical protein